ncbi:hypothetical protein LINPERPRIM_LOCUS31108 [Linum perenne]
MQLISGDAIAYSYGGAAASYSYNNYYAAGEYPSTNYYDYPHHHHYDSDYSHYESRAVNYYAYEQPPSLTHYAESIPTQSISLSEFNETDFEEYDSTPYGGGYDLAQTYGKPLPHSDETCYPANRISGAAVAGSDPAPQVKIKKPDAPKIEESKPEEEARVENGFDYGGIVSAGRIPAADGGGSVSVPQVEIKKPDGPKIEELKPKEMEMIEEGVEEEEEVENGYDYGGIVYAGRVPSGYGLETVDLCESLFGYWPCLEKSRRQSVEYGKGGGDCEGGEWNQTAADYLFGNSYDPYAAAGGGWPVESYQRTYGEEL